MSPLYEQDSLVDYTVKGAKLTLKGIRVLSNALAEHKQKQLLPQSTREVANVIKVFEPSRKFHNEDPYARELTGWLRSHFRKTRIEVQKGSSRPDIVVGNVAVEVKGPTGRRELETIGSKLLRYSNHFANLIIVLFEVDDRLKQSAYYQEWKHGIRHKFPTAQVIEL